MKKAFAIILWALWVSILHGQVISMTIHGQLKDAASGENLLNATVKLVRAKDSVTERQIISNKNGFFINRVPEGKYFLKLSYIGYRDTTYFITVESQDSVCNAGIMMMTKSGGDLMPITVKSSIPPVITKNDTIMFNASAFKTGPNATVEELLKRLPGIAVDRDGNITFQGESIRKIYVDGKALFFNDPRLTTKSFLADMVQKVEAFNEKSERARLTGIPDDNPDKALNLQLKPDRKKGYFGTIEAGYASHNSYSVTASANHLKGDAISMTGAGYNNSGLDRVNNRAKNISLNYQNRLIQNLLFSISYASNTTNGRSWFYNQRHTFMADSSLLQEREETSTTQSSSHNFNLGINYKIDSFSSFGITAAFGLQCTSNNTENMANNHIEKAGLTQPVNGALTNNKTNANGWNSNINLNYNRRFRKQGRFFGLHINSNNNQLSGDGGLVSLINFFDQLSMPVDSVERNSHSDENSRGGALGLGISYTEPIGKNQVLDFYYNLNSSNSKSSRQIYNYNPITGKYDEPDSIASNSFENNRGEQSFGIGYNNFRSSKFHYQAGIGASIDRQQNINKMATHANIEQKTFNIFPRASLLYSINKQQSIRLRYNGRSRQPSIAELQPIPDFSNPLLIRLGNPSLKQEFNNEITTEYRNFNAKKMSNLTLQANFRNTLNRIVNSIITNAQGIQEQQYVNMNGDYGIGGSVNYDMPLIKPQKPLDLRYNAAVSYYRDANLVNKELNKRSSASISQRLTLNYHMGEKLSASTAGNFNLNNTKYSIQTARKNTFISQQYSGNISYEFLKQFVFYTDFNISFTNTLGDLKAYNSVVWNVTIIKRMFKNKGELRLSILDILNDKKDFNQNIGDNYIETTRTEVVKRISKLSFVYRFRGNKM